VIGVGLNEGFTNPFDATKSRHTSLTQRRVAQPLNSRTDFQDIQPKLGGSGENTHGVWHATRGNKNGTSLQETGRN
jgi:hypothetical protein